MNDLRYRAKVDIWVAIASIVTGLFFTFLVSQIDTFSDDTVGPRFFPYALSFIIIGIGLLIGISAGMNRQTRKLDSSGESLANENEQPDENSFGFRDSDIHRMLAVVAVGLVYIGLFYAFGYLFATILALFFMLLAFGNRGLIKLLIISVAGALLYRYLFISLLGVYSAPGKIFDVENFLVALF